MTDRIAYLISSGSYSDYGVAAVVLDKAAAEHIRDTLGGDYEVEERPLVESIEDFGHPPFKRGIIFLDADTGEITHVAYSTDEPVFGREAPVADLSVHGRDRVRHVRRIRIMVTAQGETSACKAAADYGAELAAEIAAGIPASNAVAGFNARYQGAGQRLTPASDKGSGE